MIYNYTKKDKNEYYSLIVRLVSLVDVDDISEWQKLLQDIDCINTSVKRQKEMELIVKEKLNG